MRRILIILTMTAVANIYGGGGVIVTQGNCCGTGGGTAGVPYETYGKNGVNGQDSLGLGGSLNQNTSIYMGGFNYINYSIIPTFLGGTDTLGLASGHITGFGTGKNIVTASYNDLDYTTIQTGTDTATGELHTELGYGSLITGMRKQLVAKYDEVGKGQLFFDLNENTNNPTAPIARVFFDDTNETPDRAVMKIILRNGYTGEYIHLYDDSNNDIIIVKNDGTVVIPLLQFDDDANAGSGGITAGGLYQTSPTNTLGLPAGVVMIKQ